MLEKYRAYSPRHSPSLTMRTSVRFPPVLPWAFIYISLRLWATVAWCSISYSSDPQLPPFLGREKFSQRTQLRESSSYSRHISWLVGLQDTLEIRLPMAWSISRSRILKASGERRYIVVYRFFFFFILIKFLCLRLLGAPSIQTRRDNYRRHWAPFLFAMPTRKTTSIQGRVVSAQCRIGTIWQRKKIGRKAFSWNDYNPLDTHRSFPRIGTIETRGGINISDLV